MQAFKNEIDQKPYVESLYTFDVPLVCAPKKIHKDRDVDTDAKVDDAKNKVPLNLLDTAFSWELLI